MAYTQPSTYPWDTEDGDFILSEDMNDIVEGLEEHIERHIGDDAPDGIGLGNALGWDSDDDIEVKSNAIGSAEIDTTDTYDWSDLHTFSGDINVPDSNNIIFGTDDDISIAYVDSPEHLLIKDEQSGEDIIEIEKSKDVGFLGEVTADKGFITGSSIVDGTANDGDGEVIYDGSKYKLTKEVMSDVIEYIDIVGTHNNDEHDDDFALESDFNKHDNTYHDDAYALDSDFDTHNNDYHTDDYAKESDFDTHDNTYHTDAYALESDFNTHDNTYHSQDFAGAGDNAGNGNEIISHPHLPQSTVSSSATYLAEFFMSSMIGTYDVYVEGTEEDDNDGSYVELTVWLNDNEVGDALEIGGGATESKTFTVSGVSAGDRIIVKGEDVGADSSTVRLDEFDLKIKEGVKVI